ncbi:MAG: hypothetical protein K9K66_05775 [Desulfarculaceae bacterium]|nr:hypothetical protein [Desulfarculaceae bacterium]MCF8071246.1 hypothetical protein [Desulfarculaceae bacterium]MCF8101151.1 hypothetical protein [Desulfarculaceae bacterium]MCF8115300.1 hypothetical protein [Desulfarculaceae bacterium]
MSKILAWIPIVVTAMLMWYARVTNVGVTHYNLFLLGLLAWSLVVIVFYRILWKPRS